MITHIVKSFVLTWIAALTLGLLYGAAIVHRISPRDLWIMGVVQISFVISSVIAVLITPLTAWALYQRSAPVKWLVTLWLCLAVFCSVVTPLNAVLALYGSIALGILGLIFIRRYAADMTTKSPNQAIQRTAR